MTKPLRRTDDPVDRLAQRIGELEAAVRDLSRPRDFQIPVLAADPPETDITNMWLMPDGRIRARHRNPAGTAFVYREWVSTTAGSGSSGTAPAPPAPAPISRTGKWTATWSQSYRQSGSARTDGGVTRLYYGSSGDSFNGMNRSLVGFDTAAIAAALAGSTIRAVRVALTNDHAYWNAGAWIHFGIHNFSTEPASWAGGGIPSSMAQKYLFKRDQHREVALPLSFASAIRDGWGYGVALESPSTSRDFYGFAYGVGSGITPPVLTVEYDK